jgi:hypothetical protein
VGDADVGAALVGTEAAVVAAAAAELGAAGVVAGGAVGGSVLSPAGVVVLVAVGVGFAAGPALEVDALPQAESARATSKAVNAVRRPDM